MSWSRNARLFALEEVRDGYLPVLEIAREIFRLGFYRWASLELFSRSWGKLVEALGLDDAVSGEVDVSRVGISGQSRL